MAWRARVAQPIGVTATGLLSVAIEYYDDAAPTVTLWAKAWDLPIDATTAQLQAAVELEGQKARAWLAARDAARAAVPAGTNIPIP